MDLALKNWIAKLKPHWRFIAFELCILLGGLLVLPVFRLIPILLESVWTGSQNAPQTSGMGGDVGSSVSAPDPGFHQFIPNFYWDVGEGETFQTGLKAAPFFELLDFSPGAGPITLRIFMGGETRAAGQTVDISFLPGEHCAFGDGRACIYQFDSSGGGRVVFASIHSGLGAEAEAFRDWVEGTGFNQAVQNHETVTTRMQALAGAGVAVSQGAAQIDGLSLSIVVRIPPEHMTAYMQTPVEQLLDVVVDLNALDPAYLSQDLLIFETCGWRLPDEVPVPGVPDTSTSVYLGVIVSPVP